MHSIHNALSFSAYSPSTLTHNGVSLTLRPLIPTELQILYNYAQSLDWDFLTMKSLEHLEAELPGSVWGAFMEDGTLVCE
jgi:hypothetical protein